MANNAIPVLSILSFPWKRESGFQSLDSRMRGNDKFSLLYEFAFPTAY